MSAEWIPKLTDAQLRWHVGDAARDLERAVAAALVAADELAALLAEARARSTVEA